MPIVSIDWTKIKSLYAGDTQFVALTDQHIAILSSLAEQLSWEKTWRTSDYDFSDKGTLDLEIADLQANLTMPVAITDIIGLIDDVETLLTEIRDLTQGQGGCCGETAPLPNPYESPNADNYPTTPPATYGDGETIADSDDWIELVCNAAHNYVDLLKETSNELDKLITTGALIVGGVAGLLALLTSAGILSAIAYSAASSATSALLALVVKTIIADSVDDLEAARADIVCAIVHGGPEELSTAVQDAVDAEAWLGWFKWVDYETAWNVMIDGGRDGEYLEADRRTDCDCIVPVGYSWVPATAIGATPVANTFGRINTVTQSDGYIEIGEKVATGATWGCQSYPCGAQTNSWENATYQTLGIRYTVLTNNSDGQVWLNNACRGAAVPAGWKYINLYTYDVAEGIDSAWLDANSDAHNTPAGGHAKQPVGHDWNLGVLTLSDTTVGNTPMEMSFQVDLLIWNPGV